MLGLLLWFLCPVGDIYHSYHDTALVERRMLGGWYFSRSGSGWTSVHNYHHSFWIKDGWVWYVALERFNPPPPDDPFRYEPPR